MEKLTFKETVNTTPERLWEILWNDQTYREWTTPFCEGSYAESDWNEGSKILFLSPGGNGMVSRIAEKRNNEFMSFQHLGEVKNGVEDTESDKVKSWAGALENYTLRPVGKDQTELIVEMDANDDFANYFKETWPNAMQAIKRIADRN